MMKTVKTIILLLLAISNVVSAQEFKKNEDYYNDQFCSKMGGKREVRHNYTTSSGIKGYVKIDCETEEYVYEGGLDKRSSLDSIQQALFFAFITGKKPAVVIYDTDNQQGKYEYRIRQAATKAGVKYIEYVIIDAK